MQVSPNMARTKETILALKESVERFKLPAEKSELPETSGSGLGGLLGGWKHSDDLVESVSSIPRSDPKPLPDL